MWSITNNVITKAIISAIGAAQKMPVTPSFVGTIKEETINNTSLSKERGTAKCALPIDCRKMELTFCRHVKSIRER